MPEFTEKDCAHMAHALRLAERGRYSAHPNPVVGCVLVNNDEVVGEGWHRRAGEAHAEVHALADAGAQARGSTAYVTLEPCAHHGSTPPCARALLEAGVAKVIAAVRDPYSEVDGRGLEMLRNAGVAVQTGLMQAAAEAQNKGFFSRVLNRKPYLRLKLAASLDGAVSMASGESQWITGKDARADVQRLRARSGAVMTGIGTVLADNPSLNVRAADIDTGGQQPLRVVLDSHLRMPPSAGMLALPGSTLVCCIGEQDAGNLQQSGAEVMFFPTTGKRVSIREVLHELAERRINEVLVEAGPVLAGHLLDQDLVDELVIYQAPHIMGSQTRNLVSTPNWNSLADRRHIEITDVRRIGNDTRITAILSQRT